jgi:sulfur-oxidizing protein SoxA
MRQIIRSCAQCHDDRAGMKLAGASIPLGHPNGYPAYRLGWQTMASLNRRPRDCVVGVRPKPFAPDSLEMVELALCLAVRAEGLTLEMPTVRPLYHRHLRLHAISVFDHGLRASV